MPFTVIMMTGREMRKSNFIFTVYSLSWFLLLLVLQFSETNMERESLLLRECINPSVTERHSPLKYLWIREEGLCVLYSWQELQRLTLYSISVSLFSTWAKRQVWEEVKRLKFWTVELSLPVWVRRLCSRVSVALQRRALPSSISKIDSPEVPVSQLLCNDEYSRLWYPRLTRLKPELSSPANSLFPAKAVNICQWHLLFSRECLHFLL